MPFSLEQLTKSEALLSLARAQRIRLVTAESCTGGLIAGLLTEIAGSSDVIERGFVPYSNEAKHDLLGVPKEVIAAEGAVSDSVARFMAEGALTNSKADVSIAATGVAGPGGGTEEKPVGLVYIALAATGKETVSEEHRFGDMSRSEIRNLTITKALELIRSQIEI